MKKRDKIKALGIRVVKGHESHFLPLEQPERVTQTITSTRDESAQTELFENIAEYDHEVVEIEVKEYVKPENPKATDEGGPDEEVKQDPKGRMFGLGEDEV
ncbi:MAG TPA: hypothetical protein VN844_13295 [Pyrinomonadaceae bacterium]|nr:hypothetical protein [Pyrinomonadaceae bacterium]